MSLNDDELSALNNELDRRKLESVTPSGEVTRDDIIEANIVVECPRCQNQDDIDDDVCSNCGYKYS